MHTLLRNSFRILSATLFWISCHRAEDPRKVDMTPGLLCPDNYPGLQVVAREDGRSFELISVYEQNLGIAAEGRSAYTSERLRTIRDYCSNGDWKWGCEHNYCAPRLLDAGISSPVRIYMDVPLFGKNAGENLIDHFETGSFGERSHVRLQCTYPDYTVLGWANEGMPMEDYLKPGMALFVFASDDAEQHFYFRFKTPPGKLPENYTLTIEIPIESISWEPFSWTSRSSHYVKLEKSRVLIASVHIRSAE